MPNGITDCICGHPVSFVWGMLGITTAEIFQKCTGLHIDEEEYVTKVKQTIQKTHSKR